MPEEPKKIAFPVLFDHCPTCGCKDRLGEAAMQELRDNGMLPKEAFKDGMWWQMPMLDQAHPPTILAPTFTIKVATTFFDICAECGTVYCTKFDMLNTQAQVQQQPPPKGNGGQQPYPRRF